MAATQWRSCIYTSLILPCLPAGRNHIVTAIFFRPAPAEAGQALSKILPAGRHGKIAHCQAHSGVIRGPLKKIRKAKSLSQKEVIASIGMGAAQYSRIESGKTDPSVSTLQKIAKALGVSLAELLNEGDATLEVNSNDKTVMEKVKLMEALNEEEKQTIYNILDAFLSKQKLKNALSNALEMAS